ncbi:hypothetical protein ACFQU1_20340 [Chelatococcus sp. GCM10030263]|uniref:hypothetical protein n=1 Tax=Chelatococcus sp. GCM10030263 TaxID=3273387 RepID=UPI0036097565
MLSLTPTEHSNPDSRIIAAAREAIGLNLDYRNDLDKEGCNLDRLFEAEAQATEIVSEAPAQGLDAMKAKAALVKHLTLKTPDGADISPLADERERLSWSLACDVESFTPLAVSPDAELIELSRLWQELNAEASTAFDAASALEDQTEYPEDEPKEVYVRGFDVGIGLYGACATPIGKQYWYLHSREQLTRFMEQPGNLAQGCLPQARARVDEILSAIDRYEAAVAEAEERSGFAKAWAIYDGIRVHRDAIRLRIVKKPARTLEGLAAKATVALDDFTGGVEDLLERLQRDVQDGRPGNNAVLYSIVRDLLAGGSHA